MSSSCDNFGYLVFLHPQPVLVPVCSLIHHPQEGWVGTLKNHCATTGGMLRPQALLNQGLLGLELLGMKLHCPLTSQAQVSSPSLLILPRADIWSDLPDLRDTDNKFMWSAPPSTNKFQWGTPPPLTNEYQWSPLPPPVSQVLYDSPSVHEVLSIFMMHNPDRKPVSYTFSLA
jgi:hypothetical protein